MGVAKSNIGLFSKIFLAIALLVPLAGCGGGGGGGAVPPPPATTFTFRVVNNSGITVNEFYLTESTNPSWGPDLFSTDLPSGSTRDIAGVIPCGVQYDWLAINGTFASPIASAFQFNVMMPACGGLFTLTLNP